MKNSNQNNNLFIKKINYPTENSNSILKNTSILFIVIALLLSVTSCSKNTGTGCGSFQATKYKNNNHAFSNYRGYN